MNKLRPDIDQTQINLTYFNKNSTAYGEKKNFFKVNSLEYDSLWFFFGTKLYRDRI